MKKIPGIKELKRKLKKKITKENAKGLAIDVLWLFVACCICAYAVVGVMIPNGLMTGGVTGAVRILQKFVDINFSVFFYIGSGIILALVAIFLNFREVRKIIILSVLYPTVLAVFEKFDPVINYSLLSEKDLILAAIMCGVLMGITSGIVFWRGYSFAGTDAIGKILQKKFFRHVDLSKLMLGLDAIIIGSSIFVYDRNIALYALISQVITTKVIDIVLYGIETKVVQVEIITKKPEDLKQYVVNEIDRGVSVSDIRGGYTGKTRRKLTVLCSPRESILIKRFLSKKDPAAFVSVVKVETVYGYGEGFKSINGE